LRDMTSLLVSCGRYGQTEHDSVEKKREMGWAHRNCREMHGDHVLERYCGQWLANGLIPRWPCSGRSKTRDDLGFRLHSEVS